MTRATGSIIRTVNVLPIQSKGDLVWFISSNSMIPSIIDTNGTYD